VELGRTGRWATHVFVGIIGAVAEGEDELLSAHACHEELFRSSGLRVVGLGGVGVI